MHDYIISIRYRTNKKLFNSQNIAFAKPCVELNFVEKEKFTNVYKSKIKAMKAVLQLEIEKCCFP